MTNPNLKSMLEDVVAELRGYLRGKVREATLQRDEAAGALAAVENLSFPGLMTFLGLGAVDQPLANASEQQGVELRGIKDKAVVEGLEQLGIRILPEETRRKAIELVQTGQFLGDLAEATAAVLHTVPDLPVAIAQDVRSMPRLPKRLIRAIARDLIKTPSAIAGVEQDLLRDGKLSGKPEILTNAVRVLFGQATPQTIAQTLQTLLDNPTVRSAIIIYAASQGIRISEKELDAVRDSLDPYDPDLGRLVIPAFERLVSEKGLPQAVALLKRMAA